MGLTAYIYKNGHDCSNGGISSFADAVTLVNVDGPTSGYPGHPAALLVPNAQGTVRVVPAEGNPTDGYTEKRADGEKTIGPMMGGCYVASSDGRFGRAVEKIVGGRFYGAVALHDRYETPEQYATYD